ncbi:MULTISPECIES: DUF5334 family protein [Halomonas]|uniref:DUF5334 family protein n=1 Tax=Halomonas TaxID=2745 RepID=UPI001C943429|nr:MULTISPECIES: DUF5334 family protein [Halomonas]MBY6208734.1 DUF5334 family protein [Halomonas sp. DP3Y7-2]MBY6227204.1 DUF5334 family protein [Halomonas sp. DP3Y7-1]MCA0915046.1 DUF5334 family protein [Halomonas denitrificans]
MRKLITTLAATTVLAIGSSASIGQAVAWDGFDWETSSDITIESGNLVRPGEEIEYYDWEASEYRYGEVDRINSRGNSVEVEIYDYDTGEYRTFDMDR